MKKKQKYDSTLFNKYVEVINDLFLEALKKEPAETMYTILRVGGMSDADWDTFVESREAFDDFNWILKMCNKERSLKCQTRVALLMYCQAVEMTAPHEILANLLNIINGSGYLIHPFYNLCKDRKIPPSAKTKFNFIKKMARTCGKLEFINCIEEFFSDSIRNAFSHSDYIITDKFFRYSDIITIGQISIEELTVKINSCFEFYSAFMQLHKSWLHTFGSMRQYHKWPNYEVLELLSENCELYGFSIHFSNGSKATYARKKTGVESINIFPERDGINFMCGCIDDLEKVWKVDGKPFVEDEELVS